MKKYLVTNPKNKHHGKTLVMASGKYDHLGEQIGVLLTLEDEVGNYSEGFLFSELLEVEECPFLALLDKSKHPKKNAETNTLTDEEKQAYYEEEARENHHGENNYENI